MILRGAVLLIAAAMLVGCQTERSGLDYATAMRRIGPPKAGQARIVVFREKGFGGVADAGWEFALDGAVLKGLKTGTYLYVDRPAGQHQFFAAEPGFPGETHQDIAVQSGRTYFYLARNSDRKNAVIANASTGLLGYGLTLAMTSAYKNQGPVDFSPVDEAAARTTVAELKLAE
ncbi:hypothetical protein JQ561_31515 [Bradyrhizobium diazoefficiens]|uniref:hypothetical protein n=1 Tax=Bradyrhizobium sp. WYCCWR 12699 TaxID=3064203 RepID=UPI001BABDA3F|nr:MULTISPECIES: hypothetical protein [Bradyrhizobium]MBR0931160.1 hypothetical protein [Bradyrhizobium diazoefficiens]MDT4742116.1 hypothetical protein [Bradyrhizobium sp. WYCCWR 12699]